MDVDLSELVTFLRARLDADGQVANGATPGPWRHNPDKHWRKPGTAWFEEAVFAGPEGAQAICVAGTGETDDSQSMADAKHIARHDPARILAEVEAKRRTVEEYATHPDEPWPLFPLYNMASAYAQHPDYREEWKP